MNEVNDLILSLPLLDPQSPETLVPGARIAGLALHVLFDYIIPRLVEGDGSDYCYRILLFVIQDDTFAMYRGGKQIFEELDNGRGQSWFPCVQHEPRVAP